MTRKSSVLGDQLVEDVRALRALLTPEDPLAPGHVRALAAPIARKWLLDRQLLALTREVGAELKLPCLDTGIIVDTIDRGAPVEFYTSGGVVLNGQPISGYYKSKEGYPEGPVLPLEKVDYVELPPKKFLQVPRVYHNGNWFTTEQIIRFVANKCGGVHFDTERDKQWEKDLEAASSFFTVGNPDGLDEICIVEKESGGVFVVLPLERGHTWTCLDIELLAVAQSLANIRCNNLPFLVITRRNIHPEPPPQGPVRKALGRLLGLLRRDTARHDRSDQG